MTHDPMCPYTPERQGFSGINSGFSSARSYVLGFPCLCDFIASVRQDERIESLGTRVRELKPYADGYCDGQRDALNAAVKRVEAMLAPLPNTWTSMVRRWDVIAAIKGEQ